MTDRKADTAPLSFKEKAGYGLGDMASNFYLGFLAYIFCIITQTSMAQHQLPWQP